MRKTASSRLAKIKDQRLTKIERATLTICGTSRSLRHGHVTLETLLDFLRCLRFEDKIIILMNI